jgi:hypothetical protein
MFDPHFDDGGPSLQQRKNSLIRGKNLVFSPIIILFLQYSSKRSSHVPEI